MVRSGLFTSGMYIINSSLNNHFAGLICCKYVTLGEFLPARRYGSAGNSDRNVSVCPSVRSSVRLSRAGIVSKRRKLAA